MSVALDLLARRRYIAAGLELRVAESCKLASRGESAKTSEFERRAASFERRKPALVASLAATGQRTGGGRM